MKKILSMGEPILYTYNSYGSITSILSEIEEAKPWLYNNFIQIRWSKTTNLFRFAQSQHIATFCPCLRTYQMPKKLIKQLYSQDLHKFIREMIDDNYYIILRADRFFMSVYNNYNKNHMVHEMLIYGYVNNEVLIGDNIHGKYEKTTISYNELESAFWSVESDEKEYEKVEIIKIKKHTDLDIDLKQIIQHTSDYVSSHDNYEMLFDNTLVFGIKAVNAFLNTLESLDSIDIRPFHFFWEHKKLMLLRLEYLNKNGYMNISIKDIENYRKIRDDYLIIRNMVLKYNIKHNNKNIKPILDKIYILLQQEKALLSVIFSCPERYLS